MKNIELTTAEIGVGAQVTDCQFGPWTLVQDGVMSNIPHTFNQRIVDQCRDSSKLEAVSQFNKHLSKSILSVLNRNNFPLVIGGDHSCAIGTWSAVSSHYGSIGLIWIDAHLDSHTDKTSQSGAPHGMPMAALLGHGDYRLTSVVHDSPKLNPSNVVMIGIRSYESGEIELLERLGVRIMFIEEVKERGMAACLTEAKAIALNGTQGFGVTLDIDAIDPVDAPGVGSPELNGIPFMEMEKAFTEIKSEQLLGFELVEYNPFLDINKKTSNLAKSFIWRLFKD
jgi:arginase